MLELLANKNYMLCVCAFTFQLGIFSTFGTIVGSFSARLGFSSLDNVYFGGALITSGIIGSVIIGVLLDKYQKYKIVMLSIILLSIVLLVSAFIIVHYRSAFWLTVMFGLFGLTVIPVGPLCFGFAVELTFPVEEAVSNGMMVMISRVYASGVGFLAQWLT